MQEKILEGNLTIQKQKNELEDKDKSVQQLKEVVLEVSFSDYPLNQIYYLPSFSCIVSEL